MLGAVSGIIAWAQNLPMIGKALVSGALVALFLGILTVLLVVLWTPKIEAPADKAKISFHIYGDARLPTIIEQENIWRYYYFPWIVKHTFKPDGEVTMEGSMIILTFDKPIYVMTLRVSSPDFPLMDFEVRDYTSRTAIILFRQSLPAGNLVIESA